MWVIYDWANRNPGTPLTSFLRMNWINPLCGVRSGLRTGLRPMSVHQCQLVCPSKSVTSSSRSTWEPSALEVTLDNWPPTSPSDSVSLAVGICFEGTFPPSRCQSVSIVHQNQMLVVEVIFFGFILSVPVLLLHHRPGRMKHCNI